MTTRPVSVPPSGPGLVPLTTPARSGVAGPRGARVRVAPGAGRPPPRRGGIAARRLAEPELPRLRRPHGDGGVRGRAGPLARARRCAADRRHVRRGGAVALPPPARRRRARGARDRGAPRDLGGAARAAPPDPLRAPRGRARRLRPRAARALSARACPADRE